MNVSNHCYERYCERYLNMQDFKKYIIENKEKLNAEINSLFEGSQFIYRGKLATIDDSGRFYTKDQNIFVVNDANDCIKTMYRIDFGFPGDINQSVIRGLLAEIKKLNAKLDKEKDKQKEEIIRKEVELDNVNMSIKLLEEKMKYYRCQKSVLEQEIELIKERSNGLECDIKKIAYQLCNSLDYRKELLKIAK